MDEIMITNIADVPSEHKREHKEYEYYRRAILPGGTANQCALSVYEVPPGKAAYPYHYHSKNEEVFYIISGSGILKTPKGARAVSPGDFLFFPACENGAHKLTNNSETEPLVYIDFDTENDLEVAFYPDSGKLGVGGKNVPFRLFRTNTTVGYYDGE
jgi:uncharacterized cupin superfamily protein